MTKREIYDNVVQLTAELAKTNVAPKIFEAAIDGDAVKAQTIIDFFPVFYPELYKKIVNFGKEFNKLVGDSEEDRENFRNILENCEFMMYNLAETKVITEIAKAVETGDSTKVQEVIDTFKKDYSVFAENLINFQEEYTAYRDAHMTGDKGEIFGTKTDEENGIFVFDTNVINALSFYVLNILANISDVYFFCDVEGAAEPFFTAIEETTNQTFSEFVACYNIIDWVGKGKEYQTFGELLCDAMVHRFEEKYE